MEAFSFLPPTNASGKRKPTWPSKKRSHLDSHLALRTLPEAVFFGRRPTLSHVKAIREYHRALALDPELDEARNQLALIYSHIGYFATPYEKGETRPSQIRIITLQVIEWPETLAFQEAMKKLWMRCRQSRRM